MSYNYIIEETSWNPKNYDIESDENIFKIWFYDIIWEEEYGHGVTRGRFEIDRKTGRGEDAITFKQIDFSKYL